MNTTTDRRVGRAAVVASITMLLIVLATATAAVSPALSRWLASTLSARGYHVGEAIDLPADLYRHREVTAFVFERETCGACLKSLAALTRFVSASRGIANAGVMVVVPAPAPRTDSLVVGMGLTEDSVASVTANSVRVATVPALVLVDKKGRILWAHEGVLKLGEEAEAISIMRTPVVR